MEKINLLLALHNHQPVGNFDFVFQEAYDRAYKPFLDVLERHSGVKVSLHYSGILLDWLQHKHPEFLSRLRVLSQSGQVEFLTGAYYEPILPIIPRTDRKGQIEKLTGRIEELFGATPTGMWLAERVWEHQVTASLVEAGARFVLLDDTHFLSTGLRKDELAGYYVTEDGGKSLYLFPMSKALRYSIPFQPVERTMEYLKNLADGESDQLVVFGDDGEKFGVWPTTYKHVYEDGWLEEFFSTLEGSADWLKVTHFSEVLEKVRPRGRIYLPDASYTEMTHWVLPPLAFKGYEEFVKELEDEPKLGRYREFVRGGFWRNFFVRYPESNRLHKKMLRVSERAHAVKSKGKRLSRALDKLWAGQCNDAYWHGVFGGLYLPHLRSATYQNLLSAESELNAIDKSEKIQVDETDFDCDGRGEILVESPTLNLYFKPDAGGSIVELDYLPLRWNLANVMTRREEGYHDRLRKLGEMKDERDNASASIHDLILEKEKNLEKHLGYDWYDRTLFLDHFLKDDVTIEDFSNCRYGEEGDFVNQKYEYEISRGPDSVKVSFSRNGNVWRDGVPHPLTITKTFLLTRGSERLDISYELINGTEEPLRLWFGIELCLALSSGDARDRYYVFQGKPVEDVLLRSKGEVASVRSVSLVDEWLKCCVGLSISEPATLWRFPIETVSLSEGGFEKVYQGSILFPQWKFRLEDVWRVGLTLDITKMREK